MHFLVKRFEQTTCYLKAASSVDITPKTIPFFDQHAVNMQVLA
jgi:hypothetical protein